MNEHCRHPFLRFIPPRSAVVLVVMGLCLGMIAWVMVGALQKTRGGMTRSQTYNHLKWLSLSLHNFEAAHFRLPPAIGGTPQAQVGIVIENPDGEAAAFSKQFATVYLPTHGFLLPYLECEPLYRSMEIIDATGPTPVTVIVPTAGSVKRAYQTTIPEFLDPRDPSVGNGAAGHLIVSPANWNSPLNPPSGGGGSGTTSFAANFKLFAALNKSDSAVQSFDRALTIAGIEDGSSNTVVFAQKYAVCTAAAPIPDAETNQGIPVLPAGSGGSLWAEPNLNENSPFFGYPQGGNSNYTTGWGLKFQVRPDPFDGKCNPYRASTPHQFGILVELADGTVRTVSPSVSPETWYRAVTPDDGKEMGKDW